MVGAVGRVAVREAVGHALLRVTEAKMHAPAAVVESDVRRGMAAVESFRESVAALASFRAVDALERGLVPEVQSFALFGRHRARDVGGRRGRARVHNATFLLRRISSRSLRAASTCVSCHSEKPSDSVSLPVTPNGSFGKVRSARSLMQQSAGYAPHVG